MPVAHEGLKEGAPWLTRPFKLTISVTAKCNLTCQHCYTDCGAATTAPELSFEEWVRVLNELIDEGFITVFFEGGEPFARHDFEQIAAHAAKKMFVAVRTNGTLIDAARAARLTSIGVGRVYVDLSGATASTHDQATGVPGSFVAATTALLALRDRGVPTTVLTILTRNSAPELQALVDLANAVGCDEIGVLRLYPLGRAKKNWNALSLTLEEMQTRIESVTAPPGLSLMQSWHPNDGNCCWQNAAIDPFGRSIGCPYLREYTNYGNVREVPFRETWHHPLYRSLRSGKVHDACPECSRTQLSRGGCRSTAYAFHGDWEAPDPFCAHLNRGVDLRALPDRSLRQES
jgi:radical SAM protein with 4Fe4S-binding SPASM domain